MQDALRGNITPEMKLVAESEGIDVQKIVRGLSDGRIIIPKNVEGKTKAVAIGKGPQNQDQCKCWFII